MRWRGRGGGGGGALHLVPHGAAGRGVFAAGLLDRRPSAICRSSCYTDPEGGDARAARARADRCAEPRETTAPRTTVHTRERAATTVHRVCL